MRTSWMRHMLVAAAAGLLVCSALPVHAQERRFGAGIILGEPTGLSAKLWVGEKAAVDAAVAWSFQGDGAFYLHASYLYHFFNLEPTLPDSFSAYVGGGGKIVFRKDTELGLRIPVGLSYMLSEVPLEAFLEVAPGILLIPGTDADIGGGIGIRYYF